MTRRYEKKRMQTYSVDQLKSALDTAKSKEKNPNASADFFGVPRSTLLNHLNEKVSKLGKL